MRKTSHARTVNPLTVPDGHRSCEDVRSCQWSSEAPRYACACRLNPRVCHHQDQTSRLHAVCQAIFMTKQSLSSAPFLGQEGTLLKIDRVPLQFESDSDLLDQLAAQTRSWHGKTVIMA